MLSLPVELVLLTEAIPELFVCSPVNYLYMHLSVS